MNFAQAFSETLGKEAAAPAATPSPASQGISSDDMKSYVDAKFEALKADLLSEMKKPVETPQETDKGSQETDKGSQENNNKGGTNDASDSDLSSGQSDS